MHDVARRIENEEKHCEPSMEFTSRIVRVMRDFFNALPDSVMLVEDRGKLQSIDGLIAICCHYNEHRDLRKKFTCDTYLQIALQGLLDEAHRGKDAVLDPHRRRVTIKYFGEPGKDVVVTGTFDDWAWSIMMTPVEGYTGHYQRTLMLKKDEEYQYRFAVDSQESTQGISVKEDWRGSKNSYI